MEGSTDKTSAPGFIMILLVLLATGTVLVFGKGDNAKNEGVYPVIRKPVQGDFVFKKDRVDIALSHEPLETKQVVIFAYDEQGHQVGLVKPVYERKVTIRSVDVHNYRVFFRGGKVSAYEINRGNRKQCVPFIDILLQARESGRRFGVQECLYPVCTRCMDVCMVDTYSVIEMKTLEDGAIFPVFHNEGCPRCGKCIVACKQKVICNSRELPPTVNPEKMDEVEPTFDNLEHITY